MGEEQGDDIYLRRYEHFPEYYKAANIKQGLWTAPYYDCNGLVKMWKITYAAPCFGWDSLRNRIEFKGAVAVSMDIRMLDIDQCPTNIGCPMPSRTPTNVTKHLPIVYLFLAEVSKLEATSVNAIKVTSTLSRIQSPTLTVS